MYLFFDTETTGLPANWKAPVTDLGNWPRLVQLAWLYYDGRGNLIGQGDFIIYPRGFLIPSESAKIHSITTARARMLGHDLAVTLKALDALVQDAGCLVAHNMDFDEKVIGAEFLRCKLFNPLPYKKRICTMSGSSAFCRMPGPYGNKWPTLAELHQKLFGNGFREAHNAAADIAATARCFWELKRLGVIT